jgi:molybdopterin converting factor small subunit
MIDLQAEVSPVVQVAVHYLAQVRRAAAVAGEVVTVPQGSTLRQLVVQIACQHDDAFRAMVLDGAGQPQRTLLYAVGEEQADLDQVLRNGDRVTILAPMAGG